MILSMLISATLVAADANGPPYPLGGPATSEGAMLTVSHLLAATQAGDDVAFDKIARGMVIMLAPDMGYPVSRAKFAESLKNCSGFQVVSARPFPKLPQAQAVQVSMHCVDQQRSQAVDSIAEIMADNEHAFVMFPGGVSRVWPNSNP